MIMTFADPQIEVYFI